MNPITHSLSLYTQGMTLPQAFYVDEFVFKEDLRQIFFKNWLFVGHSCEVARPGDYLTVNIGSESVIVVRDRAGQLHAHFNVCRHRGSKIVFNQRGQTEAFVCPYHQWTYRPNGNLVGARLMGADFDKSCYSLTSAHVRELAGLLFVCLAAVPPDFAAAEAAIAPQLTPHRLERAKIIAGDRYTIKANWKMIIENNRECYHCQGHPEFALSNYDLGLPGDDRHDHDFTYRLADSYRQWEALGLSPREVNFPNGSWFRVSRFPLKEGCLTESLDGRLTAPLMGDFQEPTVGSLRLIGLPNFWAHANADYAMTTRVIPLSPELTQIDVAFLVHEAAVANHDYQVDKVTAVWRATSEQDWQLCEHNYAGICSSAYLPGPLSPLMEKSVAQFHHWYLQQMQGQRLAAA
ncbi:MAG: aromatic ring-hydroxylating dioxygenase subunit alpha [Cyanophyceae cyanobacterium]